MIVGALVEYFEGVLTVYDSSVSRAGNDSSWLATLTAMLVSALSLALACSGVPCLPAGALFDGWGNMSFV